MHVKFSLSQPLMGPMILPPTVVYQRPKVLRFCSLIKYRARTKNIFHILQSLEYFYDTSPSAPISRLIITSSYHCMGLFHHPSFHNILKFKSKFELKRNQYSSRKCNSPYSARSLVLFIFLSSNKPSFQIALFSS